MAGPARAGADVETVLHLNEQRWLQQADQREDLRFLYAMPYAANATSLHEVLQVPPCPALPCPRPAAAATSTRLSEDPIFLQAALLSYSSLLDWTALVMLLPTHPEIRFGQTVLDDILSILL